MSLPTASKHCDKVSCKTTLTIHLAGAVLGGLLRLCDSTVQYGM